MWFYMKFVQKPVHQFQSLVAPYLEWSSSHETTIHIYLLLKFKVWFKNIYGNVNNTET